MASCVEGFSLLWDPQNEFTRSVHIKIHYFSCNFPPLPGLPYPVPGCTCNGNLTKQIWAVRRSIFSSYSSVETILSHHVHDDVEEDWSGLFDVITNLYSSIVAIWKIALSFYGVYIIASPFNKQDIFCPNVHTAVRCENKKPYITLDCWTTFSPYVHVACFSALTY